MAVKRKKRSPEQKEVQGKTKAQILVYVAESMNCSMIDIRHHLRNSMNIRNTKGIRKHVNELVGQNLLIKQAKGKGLPDQFSIGAKFSSFRNCYNFLNKHGMSLGFLKSKYAKLMISGNNFLIDGILNTSKKLLIDSYHFLQDDEKVKQFISEVLNSSESEQLTAELISEKDRLLRRIPERLILSIENVSFDTLDDSIEELEGYLGIPIKNTIYALLDRFLLQGQGNEVISIISASPSSMDYFLNFRTEGLFFTASELMFAFGPVIGQQRTVQKNYIIQIEKKLDLIDEEFKHLEEEFNSTGVEPTPQALREALGGLGELFMSVRSNDFLNQNPLVSALKAYFTIDALNGRVVMNEYSRKLLNDVLLPQMKQQVLNV